MATVALSPASSPFVRLLRSRLGKSLLSFAKAIPGGKFVFNSTFDPRTGFHVGTGDSATDWDERARRNARYFIAVDDADTTQTFDRSGERDLNEILLRNIPVRPDWKALEIGCGIGRLLRPLSHRIAEVHGVDVSAEMIRQGGEYVADCPNITFHQTTGRFESLEDNTFDFIYSYRVFQHIPHRHVVEGYLQEAARVLKEDGLFRFQICLRDESRAVRNAGTWFGTLFDRYEIRPLVESYGLTLSGAEIEESPVDQSLWTYAMITCQKRGR